MIPPALNNSESPAATHSQLTRTQIFARLLLAVGVILCAVLYPESRDLNPAIPARKHSFGFADDAFQELMLLLGVVALTVLVTSVGIIHQRVIRLMEWLRNPSATLRRLSALAIFLLSMPILYGMAVVRHRILFPNWHDEGMYRLQTTLLAHGKIAMPGLPLPDFFEVPYVVVDRVYAPVYFPGTALLHVPSVWLHLPYVVIPLIIAGVILAILYLVVTELIDAIAGWLAVLLMISLNLFRWLATAEMSHPAGAMFGLIIMWSWLSWRRSKRMGWIVLAAIAAPWYAITRPLDAISIVTPIALVWAWEMRRASWRMKLAAIALVATIAPPFLALQLDLNRTVSGNLLEPPLSVYNRVYFNVRSIGLQKYDPAFVPPSRVEQVRDNYWWGNVHAIKDFTTVKDAITQWFVRHDKGYGPNHQEGSEVPRLPMTFGVALPTLLLVTFFPAALAGLTDTRRRLFYGIFWCYLAGTGCFYLYIQQYVLAVTPAVIFSVLLGARMIEKAYPMRGIAGFLIPTAIFVLAMHRIWLNDQDNFNDNSNGTPMRWAYEIIPAKAESGEVKLPAIVLFRYDFAEPSALKEPCYNWEVPWPDDAPIIRAHDFAYEGNPRADRAQFEECHEERNEPLYRYYAAKKPKCTVYRYDQLHDVFEPLGPVTELAARTAKAASTRPGGGKGN